MTATDTAPATTEQTLSKLRRLNIIAGFAHLIQMLAILALSNSFTLPVTASYVEGPPGTPASTPVVLLDSRIGWGVALFFGLSALFHFIVASPLFYKRYAAGLVEQRNYFRWVEYSLSSSVMIVLIAQVTGITDVAALIALFGVNASMILFGLVMERVNVGREAVDWRPFIFGCIAGAVPWIAIGIQLIVSTTEGDGVPGFVFAIFVTLFVLFNTFAINMWLQYRGRGRWADPVFAERVYLILSLVAKSALAWQVYGGALAGS